MNRDGANISFWQNRMPVYQGKASGNPGRAFDVVIVGGGITGLATAYQLQKNGKNCILIESHNIGYGTTSGTTAHLNTLLEASYSEVDKSFNEETSKLLFNACVNAVARLASNIKELNIECDFEYKDAYMFSQNKEQSDELENIIKSSQKAGLKMDFTSHNPIAVPYEKVAVIKGQAQFHPLKYIYGLAKGFEDAGGVLLQNCMMQSYEYDKIVTLKTSQGEIIANQVVFATHIPPGINLLHFRCSPYRSYVLGVRLKNDSYPDCLLYDMYDPYRYYRTHIEEGKKYLLIGGEDHKTGHDENTQQPLERLRKYVETYFSVEKISFKWSSQFYTSADGLGYIGVLPGHLENVFVATGFGGNGMTYSHISANVLSDLILKGESVYEKMFAPTRIKPVAGFSAFVKENTDTIKEFVSKRIGVREIDTLGGIEEGEGKVVKFKGETAGLSKNEGAFNAVDPVCKHAKCIVVWNVTERSWDCPCHGARYSPDGEVLNAPSTLKLDKMDII